VLWRLTATGLGRVSNKRKRPKNIKTTDGPGFEPAQANVQLNSSMKNAPHHLRGIFADADANARRKVL
jgi:hypothetical protein